MSDHDQITVSFGHGKRVEAQINGFRIATDQSVDNGGDASAPEPYALFLASLATCAGIYVLGFCQKRDIPSDGIILRQIPQRNAEGKIAGLAIDIVVPPSFPAKYHSALIRAANMCAVKKTIENPPQFSVRTVVEG